MRHSRSTISGAVGFVSIIATIDAAPPSSAATDAHNAAARTTSTGDPLCHKASTTIRRLSSRTSFPPEQTVILSSFLHSTHPFLLKSDTDPAVVFDHTHRAVLDRRQVPGINPPLPTSRSVLPGAGCTGLTTRCRQSGFAVTGIERFRRANLVPLRSQPSLPVTGLSTHTPVRVGNASLERLVHIAAAMHVKAPTLHRMARQ